LSTQKTAQKPAIASDLGIQTKDACRHLNKDMINGPMNKRKRHKTGRSITTPQPSRRSASGTWLYGRHACVAALMNPKRQVNRFVLTRNADSDLDIPVGEKTMEAEIVDRQTIESFLPADCVHQGIAVLVSPLPHVGLHETVSALNESSRAVFLILDQANDPRNIGAILRTAAAFGVSGVILPDRGTPEESGALAKAAAGALETLPMFRVTNLVRTMEEMKEHGFWCVGVDGYAELELSEIDFTGRIVIALGAEGKGLRRLTRETCDHLGKISISHAMESLNLSNAAAITLYEISRQQGKK